MLVLGFLRINKLRFKNINAFESPSRNPKVRLRKLKKGIKKAFDKLTKADIEKYFEK